MHKISRCWNLSSELVLLRHFDPYLKAPNISKDQISRYYQHKMIHMVTFEHPRIQDNIKLQRDYPKLGDLAGLLHKKGDKFGFVSFVSDFVYSQGVSHS